MSDNRISIPEWGIDASDNVSKEDILLLLQQRIIAMLSGGDMMGFLQMMYRLDIPEQQLEQALDAPNAHELLAQLIWDRQMQKSAMRKSATPSKRDEDTDLAW